MSYISAYKDINWPLLLLVFVAILVIKPQLVRCTRRLLATRGVKKAHEAFHNDACREAKR